MKNRKGTFYTLITAKHSVIESFAIISPQYFGQYAQ